MVHLHVWETNKVYWQHLYFHLFQVPLKQGHKLSLAKISAATDSNSHITGKYTLQYFLFKKFFFIFQQWQDVPTLKDFFSPDNVSRNVSFLIHFAYVLNEWSHTSCKKSELHNSIKSNRCNRMLQKWKCWKYLKF